MSIDWIAFGILFPAHAGMIPVTVEPVATTEAVPRACGDDPTLKSIEVI